MTRRLTPTPTYGTQEGGYPVGSPEAADVIERVRRVMNPRLYRQDGKRQKRVWDGPVVMNREPFPPRAEDVTE